MTITFIGGGNMATAIAGGQIARGRPAGDLAVVEPLEAQRAKLARRFPEMRVHASADADAVAGAEVVVLAVKPQHMREACRSIAAHIDRIGVVLSIAAGTRVRDIARWLGGCDRIVRAMPNTPALVGAGLSGLWAAPSVDARGRASAAAILEVCGEVLWVEREEALDAVTGVSGSGPAYVFYFIESLEAAARAQGFGAADARKLACATFDGAVRLALASSDPLAVLRAQVTSKGGTTERGVAALEAAGVAGAIAAAVEAATRRAAEMADLYGRDE
ncbi:MAG: pyrroline-5-carboxylate reductase [Burkholderiales bacterium]|nr:pyrroline-5-carboxylate reductase [Burkholderiales bacterium]